MSNRIDSALERQFTLAEGAHTPPRLLAAMRHAVFPGGARIRPQLCLAVAAACSEDAPALSDAAAVAIELIHCASLAHDDMPCFDDADLRRGRPTVHKAWGEPLALLAGDALIVMAFEALARGAQDCEPGQVLRLPALLALVAGSAGVRDGIVGGQAWECEPRVDLGRYQQAKTGALFVAAACAGALAAGRPSAPWMRLGECLGEAYQVADDIRDVLGDAAALGKPAGQDAHHGRPSAAADLGLLGALQHFQGLMQSAIASVPDCPNREMLRQLVRSESERLVPRVACAQLLEAAGMVLPEGELYAVLPGLHSAAGVSGASALHGVAR